MARSSSFAVLTSAAVVATGLVFAAVPGFAQTAAAPSYSTEDVIAHFAKAADLGETRTLCLGSPEQCGYENEAAAPVQPQPFNLRIQFPLNSANLTPEAEQQLGVFAKAALSDTLQRAQFQIDGHTDGRGGEVLNQELSERRASSVMSYLVAHGVSADRLAARGHGESQPLSGDPMNDANRRVEASLSGVR